MYINVKNSMINFDKVCCITLNDNKILIYFEYSPETAYRAEYKTKEEAKAAYIELEKLLTGKV